MNRLGLSVFLFLAGCMEAQADSWPNPRGNMGGVALSSAGSSSTFVSQTAIGPSNSTNCANSVGVEYSNVGANGCEETNPSSSPSTVYFSGKGANRDSATTTGGGVTLAPGLGAKRIAFTAANCAGDTVTVVTNGITTSVGTEGVNFVCAAQTNAVCATNFAVWASTIGGVTSVANTPTSGTAYLLRDLTKTPFIGLLDLSTSDATCAAITQGTDAGTAIYNKNFVFVRGGGFQIQGTDNVGAIALYTKGLDNTASLNYGVIAGGACATLTIAVAGAVDGDVVALGIPNALASTANMIFDGWVSAADTVTVRDCCTLLAGSCADPAAATVRAAVTRMTP